MRIVKFRFEFKSRFMGIRLASSVICRLMVIVYSV